MLGADLSETLCSGLDDPNSAVLCITEGVEGSLAQFTFRWNPSSPGTLMLIIGGVAYFGPEQADGTLGSLQWDSGHSSLSLQRKKRMRVTAVGGN
eukprot:227444-Rhodomonas_salina.1